MGTTDPSSSLWIAFNCAVVVLLVIDTWMAGRQTAAMNFREAVKRTFFWVALGLAMNAWVYSRFGKAAGQEFLACYLLEESLSVDNLFVFLVIFSFFKVPPAVQHRVLFLGVMGAILMRGSLIFVGIELVERFHWILYLFAGVLIITGLKMLQSGDDDQVDPERNALVRLMRRFYPVTPDYHGSSFFVVLDGVRHATPLLVVLLAIETTDLIFALDSIPAVFGVTQDHFIAFSSNIMAVLGLRALFFALAGVMGLFRFLRYGLSVVLILIGVKMLVASFWKVGTPIVLAMIGLVLTASVVASLVFPAPPEELEQESASEEQAKADESSSQGS